MAAKDQYDWPAVVEKCLDLVRTKQCAPLVSELAQVIGIPPTSLSRGLAKVGVSIADLRKAALEIEYIIDEEAANTREVSTKHPRIKTLDQLLEAAQVDLDTWEVERYVINKWEVGAKDSMDEIKIHPLFQVKAWLRRKELQALFPTIQPINISPAIPRPVKRTRKDVHRSLFIADPQTGFRRNVHTGDLVPFHDRRVLDLALQIAEYQGFDDITWGGDILDQSEWTTKYLIEPEFMFTTQPALLEFSWWLSQYRQAAPDAQIDILFGNHNRMKQAIMTHLKAAYELRAVDELEMPPAISLERLLALDALGVGFIEDYPDGKKWLTDAFFYQHASIARGGSGDTAKAILGKYRYTVGFGHIHRREMVSGKEFGREGHNIHTAFCPGCACHIDGRVPGSSSDHQWQQGFAVVEYLPERPELEPHITVVGIDEGQAIYDGKLFTARKRDAEIEKMLKSKMREIGNGYNSGKEVTA